MLFSKYPEFIDVDSRANRGVSKVTIESLENRHAITLPEKIVNNCSILDLGSCYGATGHWCLSNGASEYTGVEIQTDMANKSRELLSNYWTNFTIINDDIESFLDDAIRNEKRYDITVLFGSLYTSLNQYSILKKVSQITNKQVIIDTIYPRRMETTDASFVEIVNDQHVNSSLDDTAYVGVGARPTPAALDVMMKSLGYKNNYGILYPKPLQDLRTRDSYNTLIYRHSTDKGKFKKLPIRFISRYEKHGEKIQTVEDILKISDTNSTTQMLDVQDNVAFNTNRWEFNEEVAQRYEIEAVQHIPDYQRVINLSFNFVQQLFDEDAYILDIGSANGKTVDRFVSQGFYHTYGVECSNAMYNVSLQKDRITLGDKLPQCKGGKWNVILANWVLHFIDVNNRKQYLQDIFENMEEGGMLILTDKMSFDDDMEKMYHQFKMQNGVSKENIRNKKQALIGVLTTLPNLWYIETLKQIGFKNIQIINSNLMFNTIYARK